MKFYIYERDMDGEKWRCRDFVAGDYVVIEADSKEEAKDIFFEEENITNDDDKKLYMALPKESVDESEAELKEVGCRDWDEYYKSMYPQRPIEL